MARPQKGPRLLLAIVGALVALSYQTKKSFIHVQELPVSDPFVVTALDFVSKEFNKKSEDKYNFRIVRVLKAVQVLTNHIEYRLNLEMQRTVCPKAERNNCTFQEGELYKKIDCFFSVFAVPWFEKYKILTKNCTDG